ncbi:MAG: hypothetical protein KatS3mg113_0311 [Planctomycetaceae bacterium]|nr:MAG: hypothetical protein KatS3mg113_0311 [Planctomycetaceae bacterium]
MRRMTRRRCCQLLTGVLLTGWSRGSACAEEPRVEIEIMGRRVISWKPQLYHGWPTLTRRRNGELLLVFSGGREAHVCPFGRVELMRSQDGGVTWRWPQVLYDGPIDDRDAGIVETAFGTLLVTTFTSLAYEPLLERALRSEGSWPQEKIQEWQAVHQRLSESQRKQELGCWMLRSTDGGVTWSARYRVPVNSPHGPFVTSSGRLLYAGVALWDQHRRVGICESRDDGLTWEWLAEIPVRAGDRAEHYHELHGVEAPSGRLIVHIRNHNPQHNLEILQTESVDGGHTWSVPHPIGVWGLPSHLLRLKDGRLLMTYGYRRPPYGNQARVSDDEGRSWSEPIVLSDDGCGQDLGYPSTVELDDGTLITVWYELLAGTENAQLRQAYWRFR